jgi:hypothetical protein
MDFSRYLRMVKLPVFNLLTGEMLKACLVIQTKNGSERETATPPDGMGVLIFGDSGYTRQDERDGLEQSTGLAGVSGLATRNR